MSSTFSESWYMVAGLKTSLKPSVSVRKQTTRGKQWYMLYDPYTGNYFKVTESYYKFVSSLSFEKTVEEVWVKALEEDPENGPGQQDVINLLVELNGSGLIYFENSQDSSALYEKGAEKKKSERLKKFSNILFMRFPLVNPDKWLKSLIPLWKILFGKIGALVWFAVILYGLKAGIENADRFAEQAKTVINPENLILLYICVAVVKIIHEIGHGAVCVRYGGHINTIGVMLLLFTPLPYIDATSSWSFRNKWERIYVSSSGMIVEVFLGALACVVWVNSPPGLVQAISYNVMFTATISTVLFNANPLIRYDGYYILADLLEIPNLSQRSTNYLYAVVQKYIFGVRDKWLPADSVKEGFYLVLYGVASLVYRVSLFVVIMLFISDKYFFIGMILAGVLTFTWVYNPVKKYYKFLKSSKELHGIRSKVIKINAAVFIVLFYVFALLPLPYSYVLKGVVESKDIARVLINTAGKVKEVRAENGQMVKKGEVLMILENNVLDIEIKRAESQMFQLNVLIQQSMIRGSVENAPITKRREALGKYIDQLKERKNNLVVKAAADGFWICPLTGFLKGQWLAKGAEAGTVISDKDYRFVSVAPQEKSSELFGKNIKELQLRLNGNPEETLSVKGHMMLPHAMNILPSASLGWKGGGEVPVDPDDPEGTKTIEPFYLFYAELGRPEKIKIFHGQKGSLKVKMQSEPIMYRVIRSVRQFLQQRYRL